MPFTLRLLSWVAIAGLAAGCRVLPGAASRSRILEAGVPVHAEIAGGERHTYRFTLERGQSTRVLVDQHGTDLTFTVQTPGKTPPANLDARERGVEAIGVVADEGGPFEVAVRTVDAEAARGPYEVRLETPHPTRPDDLARLEAQRLSTDAKRLAFDPASPSQQRALELLPRTAQLWRDLGDRSAEADALATMGDVLHGRSEYARAEDSYLQALALTRTLGERREEATILNNLGLGCWRQGRLDEASAYFRQALEGWRAVSFAYGEAATLTNEGLVSWESSDYRQALDRHGAALEIFQQLHDRGGEAYALINIGMAHRSLGDDEAAMGYVSRAVAGFEAGGDWLAEGRALVRLGQIRLAGGDRQLAATEADRALTAIRRTDDRAAEAEALDLAGQIAEGSGDLAAALAHYDQALERYRTAGSRRGEATVLHRRGRALFAQGDAAAARDSLDRALAIRHDTGLRDAEADTLHEIARIESHQGKFSEARAHLRAALAITEDVRARVAGEYSRTSYLAARQRYYAAYVDLLMQMQARRPARSLIVEAFDVAERARARTLIEVLADSGVEVRRGVDAALLSRERDLQRQIDFWSYRLAQLADKEGTGTEQAEIRTRLASLLVEARELDARIRAASPRDAALMRPTPLGVGEIQQRVLDGQSVLLRFVLGDERSYAWAVTRTSIRAIELPARARIESAARAVYESLSARRSVRDQERLAQQSRQALASLSETLLAPLAPELRAKRLLVVGDGVLEMVPFAALPEPGSERVLAERHEIVMLASASMLAVLRQERARRAPAPHALAVFADPVYEAGDPRVTRQQPSAAKADPRATRSPEIPSIPRTRLLFSSIEAESILKLVLPGERFAALGFAANRTAATAPQMSDYRIVHFATHAVQDPSHPELSGIVLSMIDSSGAPEDGFLRLHDIYRSMSLRADLVVLSACQTALGKDVPGEGVVGLARGFFHAGATRVVASLYKVEDEATAEFMRAFYAAMLGPERMTPASALRAAQLSMMTQDRWRDPYSWGAFVLIGEPR